MVCPQLTNEIAVHIQAKILVKSAEYEFKDGTKCLGFHLITDWATALDNSIDGFFSVCLTETRAFKRIKIFLLFKSLLAGNYRC